VPGCTHHDRPGAVPGSRDRDRPGAVPGSKRPRQARGRAGKVDEVREGLGKRRVK